MNVSKITIGRLFNKGNYEHIRYELTVEVKEGESAAAAVINLERILEGLKPISTLCIPSQRDIDSKSQELRRMGTLTDDFWAMEYGDYKGTRMEIIARHTEALAEAIQKRARALVRAVAARQAFDDLGGVDKFNQYKLDWENDDDYEF